MAHTLDLMFKNNTEYRTRNVEYRKKSRDTSLFYIPCSVFIVLRHEHKHEHETIELANATFSRSVRSIKTSMLTRSRAASSLRRRFPMRVLVPNHRDRSSGPFDCVADPFQVVMSFVQAAVRLDSRNDFQLPLRH